MSNPVKVSLIGGPFDRIKTELTKTPPVIHVGNWKYERIDDPDSGEFLGAYSCAGKKP